MPSHEHFSFITLHEQMNVQRDHYSKLLRNHHEKKRSFPKILEEKIGELSGDNLYLEIPDADKPVVMNLHSNYLGVSACMW